MSLRCYNTCGWLILILGISLQLLNYLYSVQINAFLGNLSAEIANQFLESGLLSDSVIRYGVQLSLQQRLNELESEGISEEEFVSDLKGYALTAEATDEANEQHYEVDTSFYKYILGKHKKYSSTIYLTEQEKADGLYESAPSIPLGFAYSLLDKSEVDMLSLYMERAELCSGEECTLSVLDLGCGWGSFSLFYASKCPNCKITAISNSQSQIDYINGQAMRRGFKHLKAIKQNVNTLDVFAAERKDKDLLFDRVISVEMFEHMKNYQILLGNLKALLKCDGKVFVHMFVHRDKPYHFKLEDGWMAQHFFTGGTMASHNMLGAFDRDLQLKESWMVNGVHYSYTLETWLAKMDAKEEVMRKVIGNIYGEGDRTVTKWWMYWRTFFIACSELFKYNDGTEWFVGHYVLTPEC